MFSLLEKGGKIRPQEKTKVEFWSSLKRWKFLLVIHLYTVLLVRNGVAFRKNMTNIQVVIMTKTMQLASWWSCWYHECSMQRSILLPFLSQRRCSWWTYHYVDDLPRRIWKAMIREAQRADRCSTIVTVSWFIVATASQSLCLTGNIFVVISTQSSTHKIHLLYCDELTTLTRHSWDWERAISFKKREASRFL